MELLVRNSSLQAIAVLDTFESLIWTDKYIGCGDFEITSSVDSQIASFLTEDNYLSLDESEHTMIVEGLDIHADGENGNKIVFKGRSLESILDRRVIWTQTILTGNFQTGILKLLNENAISPTVTARKINRLVFEASTDPAITSLTIDTQFTGDNLYDAITALCLSKDVGFKMVLNDSEQFVFKLYAGVNRSYDQLVNPYVIFSPKFENLINSDYSETKATLKTVTLVAGEGEGSARLTTTVNVTAGAGLDLDRREMFTDARDISKTTSSGTLTDADYLKQLAQRGTEKLSENVFAQRFEGQVDPSRMFVYGTDFFMGDIVQTANEYGNEEKSQVTELIHSQDSSGVKVYPTFSTVA